MARSSFQNPIRSNNSPGSSVNSASDRQLRRTNQAWKRSQTAQAKAARHAARVVKSVLEGVVIVAALPQHIGKKRADLAPAPTSGIQLIDFIR